MTITAPPVHELKFLKLTANHNEFAQKLATLGWLDPSLQQYVRHVGASWFKLGDEHLSEARKMLVSKIDRATYSRAYYAAYNASKGIRYLITGHVSLKGDDHGKAGELPNDFPDAAKWAQAISKLYENRLHADYDNWTTTKSDFSQTPSEAVDSASQFISAGRTYVSNKLNLTL